MSEPVGLEQCQSAFSQQCLSDNLQEAVQYQQGTKQHYAITNQQTMIAY